MEEKKSKWRWGVNRWILLACILLGIAGANYFPPIQPHIQVAPENLTHEPLFTLPVIGSFYLTNTLVAIVLADILVLLLGWKIKKDLEKGDLIPKGITGAIETIFEYIYNMTESTAGKWAGTIFPYFMTIFLVVLVANWMELIPGVDSIGVIEESEHGYPLLTLIPGVLAALVKGSGEAVHEGGYLITPYVRAAATDLNFTAALALISVVMTQVIGVRAQGPAYFQKFINVKTFWSRPFFGVMDFLVGLLELISEFSKILSFTFRLFGNVFAGSVLLFVIGALVPVFAQSFIVLFEFFIGMIQALVFGMLTMIFMSMATQGHGGHEEEHA
ncbi:MAG: F0F1 ATP synthase subunit A [Leptolinea sp.]|nr:F0F1 ATP synthase subunit A [Leptolinea sp.]